MKTFTCFLLGLCLSATLFAQQDSNAQTLPPEELDKLVAPIALYPDSLIALILPSSTTSSDVVLAARYFSAGGDQADIDNQPWADSVKSLAHYPEVVRWMDENLSWMRQMGDVFETQPADVMNAIQRMRVQARSVGLLTDTPQQRVVVQDEEICIVPAEPDVIYVPRYDPEILWMRRPYRGDFITFGVGFGIGSWLYYDCDWWDRGIWVQHRQPGWVYQPGWRRPRNDVHVVIGAPWRPDPRRYHPDRPSYHRAPVAVRPRRMDDSHRDFHGLPDDRSRHQPGDRPGAFIAPSHQPSAPRAPNHTMTPPPPTQANRPHQGFAPGPQSQPQQPRDQPREHRGDDHRALPQAPRPPSHTPVMSPTSRPTPYAPAAAPAVRPSSGQTGGSVQTPRPVTTQGASPRPASKDKDSDDNKQNPQGGRGSNNRR
jgi:hypothetical protein